MLITFVLPFFKRLNKRSGECCSVAEEEEAKSLRVRSRRPRQISESHQLNQYVTSYKSL